MTKRCTITVQTAARLHFGLWAWGQPQEREFGGVGMMLDRPRMVVRITEARCFTAIGGPTRRVRKVAEHCRRSWSLEELPRCQVEVAAAPPPHVGFGTGTQLALAVARGLAEWCGVAEPTAAQLAAATGRGVRSAVGTHGFSYGGLVVDRGKYRGEPLGGLERRVAVPAAWRTVLVTPVDETGKAGDDERNAFANLPPVPFETTERLRHLALRRMIPAVEAADFSQFAAAVYEYGYTAGTCFAKLQHGAYATERVAATVRLLRTLGAEGAGQSSWGPTTFAFVPSEQQAERLVKRLQGHLDAGQYHLVVARPNNEGAVVQRATRSAVAE